MMRRFCEWITIRAKNTDIGATLNASHVISIRIQPEVAPPDPSDAGITLPANMKDPVPTGQWIVLIDLVNGQMHSLTFDTQGEATIEYDRLTEDLRGETIQ